MSDFTIIELNSIDSTNNYAMQLIDANKAQHGLTITAQTQTAGKGQRGNSWVDVPGQSLLMSIIVNPKLAIQDQFSFNASVAVAIVNILRKLYENTTIYIKWPNDIIVNDKKAGGVLIENVLRGSKWAYCVIGLGLNVNQPFMPGSLPHSTSLLAASDSARGVADLRDEIHGAILEACNHPLLPATAMRLYNEVLYHRGCRQKFEHEGSLFEATIIEAVPDGTLKVAQEDGSIICFRHGQIIWVWE